MRDLNSLIKSVPMIGAATLDADNTPTAVDRQGFDSMTVEIAVGIGGITFTGTNKVEFKHTHSDDDVSYTAVTDADVLLPSGSSVGSGGIVKSLTSAHAAADVTKYAYIGGKRYHKMLADFGGTHAAGTPIAVNAILGHPARAPVA